MIGKSSASTCPKAVDASRRRSSCLSAFSAVRYFSSETYPDRPLGKEVTEDGARIHRRVDLIAVGHHRVPRQRVVLLPGQLANTADLAVNGAQTHPSPWPQMMRSL